MKRLTLLACLALLQGCATSLQMPELAEFSREVERPYPPLALYTKELSAELFKRCAEFDGKVFKRCDHGRIHLGLAQQAFLESGVFAGASLGAREGHEYSASFAYVRYHSPQAKETAAVLAASMTMLLVPMRESLEVQAEVELRWRGVHLKTYEYALPMVSKTSWANMHKDHLGESITEHLVAAFIRDYQLDKAFTGELLLRTLEASDYVAGLALPGQALDYHYEGRHVYPDPFLGVQARYQHTLYPDAIDVHVYPVKGASWDDAGAALGAEMDLLLREYRLLGHRQLYAALNLPVQAEAVQAPLASGVAEGLQLDFTYEDEAGAELLSQVRLFLKEDKLIKFRKTGPQLDIRHDLDDFVAALLPQVDPPPESIFMSGLRLRLQRQSLLTDN